MPSLRPLLVRFLCAAALAAAPAFGDGAHFVPNHDPAGITEVAYSAHDASRNESSQCTTNIIVDQAPPTEIDDKLFTLWPPNHKHVAVGLDKCIAKIVDTCNAGLTIDQVVAGAKIVAYGSDEPQSVIGSGNTNGDLLATLGKPGPVQVRAERSGALDGRVYGVWFDWTNAEGITTKGTLCHFGVPHDQGSKTTPIDSGVKKGFCGGPAPYCP